MLQAVRRILVVLLAFAVIGGATSKRARSAEYGMVVAGMPCSMMMSDHASDRQAPMMPCKKITVDCIKHMGCVADPVLPAVSKSSRVLIHPAPVEYWAARSNVADFEPEPEALPPRTT